jgi:acetate kinase
MKVLVANLGSTSFKYRLFEMEAGREVMLAKGGHERVTDYGEAIDRSLAELRAQGHLAEGESPDAVGFKTVLGKDLTGCVPADERVIEALEGLAAIAPAHNPAYAAGIRSFAERLPEAKRVALFETAFYQWMPEPAKRYAVPKAWHEAGVRRFGFHGASHKYIAERSAEWLERGDVAEAVRHLYRDGPVGDIDPPCRVVSCHLGGSSSITAIRNGVAVGTSMGMSPQSGLPQNNRVGDLDSAAVGFAQAEMGLSLEEANRVLTKESGLLGLSGVSNDLRDIAEAAAAGNGEAKLALDFLVHSVRGYLGGYVFQMGGLEALVFTAGIGENNPGLRAEICAGLEDFGIRIDPEKNASLEGEGEISADGSPVRVLVLPTNEELVVARETRRLLENN